MRIPTGVSRASLAVALIALGARRVDADAQGGTADQMSLAITRAAIGENPAGDLQFRLPLLTVPGRNGLDVPIVLTYQSGPRNQQPASWVGLGFNLQVGTITRTVRYR